MVLLISLNKPAHLNNFMSQSRKSKSMESRYETLFIERGLAISLTESGFTKEEAAFILGTSRATIAAYRAGFSGFWKYCTISLPSKQVDYIRSVIERFPQYGYSSVSEFVKEAVSEKLEKMWRNMAEKD